MVSHRNFYIQIPYVEGDFWCEEYQIENKCNSLNTL